MPIDHISVQPGDTLSSLALTHLGDASRWIDLYRINVKTIAEAQKREARTMRGMRGPHWIFPGTVLRLCGAEADGGWDDA